MVDICEKHIIYFINMNTSEHEIFFFIYLNERNCTFMNISSTIQQDRENYEKKNGNNTIVESH